MKNKIVEFFNVIKEDKILFLAVIVFLIAVIFCLSIKPELTIGVLTGTALTQYVTYKAKNMKK